MDVSNVISTLLTHADPIFNGLYGMITRVRIDPDNKGWRGTLRSMRANARHERWKLPYHHVAPISLYFRAIVARACRAMVFGFSHDIATYYFVPYESQNRSPGEMDASDIFYATTARVISNLVAYPLDVFCTRMTMAERDTSYPSIWFSILDQGRKERGYDVILALDEPSSEAGNDVESKHAEPLVYLEDYAHILYSGCLLEVALSALTEVSFYLVLTQAEQLFDMEKYQNAWVLVPIATVGLAQGLVGYPLRTFQLRLQTTRGQLLGYSGNWERVKREGIFSLYRGFWGWFLFSTTKILLQDAVATTVNAYVVGNGEDD